MSIHAIPLGQVNAALLESLRENAVAESRQLDYKERLPGESDDDKRELLGDVMWNGGGWPRSPWYDVNGDRVRE